MDHASWVQSTLTASKAQKPTANHLRSKAEGKGWYAAPDELTPFQRRAFDILGIVGGGIYNAPIAWSGVKWRPDQIVVPMRSANILGTWDFMGLTRFVFLCHEARIRGYIEASSPGLLKVWLSERQATGDISRRHPNLDEALALFRAEFPANHPLIYRAPAAHAAVLA